MPHGMITSWEQIVLKFLDKFFPTKRTTRIRDKILRFRQSDNESLKDAWKHFQDLLHQAPHHGIKKRLLVQLFYDNMITMDKEKLNYRAHRADECDQVESHKQACLSGEDIYDDPSLLKFYQNNDIPPWVNLIRKREDEEGPDWVVRSKFEDEIVNFMMKKKYHLK
ncbi:reverse transcriptase domain-containing protein [Tanacetum coccineum]|uniref:Reverse transcriptase domain-containing protein n=1 Tax=Tanacetum coccineum TaxID=301880 RepID=A0ABQ5CTD7_9ASTR